MKQYRSPQSQQISVLKYVEKRFDLLYLEIRATATAMEKRLDSMNEFRDSLKDQAGKFVTRAELLTTVVAAAGIIIAIVQYFRK